MQKAHQLSQKLTNYPSFMKPMVKGLEKQGIVKDSFQNSALSTQIFCVILFEDHIQMISNLYGNHRIEIEFENRFSLEGKMLQFSRDGEYDLELFFMGNQIELWKRQLGKRLCQKFNTAPFKIKKRISVRDLCAIYLAEQDRLDKGCTQCIAVKSFRRNSLGSRQLYEDFKNQIKVMTNINHRNLCKLLNIYESDNSYYLCMPHYEGGTLLDRNLKYPLSFQQVRNIMRQILSGLKYLHERGIIHRDLKPENILMQRVDSIQIAIIDFGFACFLSKPQNLSVKCGTPGFVAPQIFKCSPKAPYNQKCDMFSLGILFYWLLTRKLPYVGKTEDQMKVQNYTFNFQNKEFPLLKSYSPQTIDILQKMLKRDPKLRISAQEALNHQFFNSKGPCFRSQKFYHKQESKLIF